MDTSAFKEIFAAEARDYLQSLNEHLLSLEQDPDNRDLLHDMFRAAHSLKGMAGTMGFSELAQFTHEMESVFELLRFGEIKASGQVIEVLFRSIDTLEILLEQTLAEKPVGPFQEMIAALKALTGKDTHQQTKIAPEILTMELDEFNRETIKQAFEQGYHAYSVLITLRKNTVLKSVRVFTIFQALEKVSTIMQSKPSALDLEEERFGVQFGLIILTLESAQEIQALLEGIPEVENVEIFPVQLEKPAFQRKEGPAAPSEIRPAAGPFKHRETLVRVETERLDKLINLVGELVISRAQVLALISEQQDNSLHKNALAQLDRVTTELQYAAMSLRMVPIKQVFDRFPRMVRDLARASHKEIRLEISGEETELDRTIVNQIGDPLVHLIRNSVDHGLETTAERVAQGKPAQGTIRLEARHEGSHILLEISDDGQGLNLHLIRRKAIERGLLEPKTLEISLQEGIDLLFHPGFSTTDAVTGLSGRGVGLDAVKSTVESLSGTIELQSVQGQSLTTVIKLPLTLAIIKALLVVVDGETMALPIQAVRENIQIERQEIKTVQRQKVIVLRDEVLPLYDLAQSLGYKPLRPQETLAVIIVEVRGQKVGFVVEDLIGQQEIVIKSLSGILENIRGIAGATVLGNGKVALILDNSTLIA